MKRRQFLGSVLATGLAASWAPGRALGANEEIRLGVIGIGSFVKIGGKGRGDIRDFRKIPGVRVAALCDCDANHLDYEVQQFHGRGEPVKAYRDFRDLLADDQIDAVSITTPNHWHSLMTILACQAGKDVFVQKPASHNLFEGRQIVEAAKKYKRIVQATHGPRNSGAVAESFDFVRQGNLGPIRCVRGLNYKPRTSIGKVDGPQPIPQGCDYDLWCGPAPTKPLMREYLHYDWHWDWTTGNGDLGNMGIHYVDACRWALGEPALPRRVMSIGARVGYEDDGETPNSMITLLDYESAPIIFEVRGLPKDVSLRSSNWERNAAQTMDSYRGVRIGTIVDCEGGYVTDGAAYSRDGQLIRKFTRTRVSTKQNFIDAVRSRDASSLHSPAIEGHLSCGLVHMANISCRLGTATSDHDIRDAVAGKLALSESLARFEDHLQANEVADSLALGPMLTMDPAAERFTGEFSESANALLSREYREPFVVPDKV